MKISISESYIKLGRQNEGDKLFESYLKDDPEWGWGWIGWSDCYWIFHGNEQNDYEKAEAILKKALSVKGLHDSITMSNVTFCLFFIIIINYISYPLHIYLLHYFDLNIFCYF